MNYFELFDIPQSPVVNRQELAKKYFELQKQNHPDYHTKADESDQNNSLEISAAINKAFNIFQNEDKTIEYFLQTVGLMEIDEKYSLPSDFLMEMMEINESVHDLPEDAIKQQVAEYGNKLKEAIRPVIENFQPASTGQQELLQLKEYYFKKKYLKRILDRLSDWRNIASRVWFYSLLV